MTHNRHHLFSLIVLLLLLNTSFALCLEDGDDDGGDNNDGPWLPAGWPYENVDATSTVGPDNEVTVAVNPSNPDNLIAGSKDYILGPKDDGGYYVWSAYFTSLDGGKTWTDGLVGRESGSILLNYRESTDPVIAFGPDGTAYYCGLAYGNGFAGQDGSALWIAESTDGGLSWQDPYIVMAWETYTVFHDKQWLIVDQENSNIYMTWTPFAPDGTRIYFARSTDGGDNWDYYEISDWMEIGDSVQGSALAVGTDGVLSVTWIDYDEHKVVLTQNFDDGDPDGWVHPRNIADADWVDSIPNADYRVPTLLSMAADPSTGQSDATLYVAWNDNARGNVDAVIIKSEDGGASWSDPIIVNDDETEHAQFFPWVAVSPEGEVGVVFYDRRDDPEDTFLEFYLAWSPDRGESWLPNIKLTTNASNGSYGYHQNGAVFMGDYVGIAISDRTAHPVWADTRLGQGQSHLFSCKVPLEELREWEG